MSQDALLTSKLTAPRKRPSLVRRGRLTARLDDGEWRRLTLISAPAGSGKTTLVTQWLAEKARPYAWLSLDDEDNRPARLLRYLAAAIAPSSGARLEALNAELLSPGPVEGEALLNAHILPALEDAGRCVLVLDDLHVLEGRAQHIVNHLLDHLPEEAHVVVTTRKDPELPLSRMRVRDEVTEIRAADLRFDDDEAGCFYREVMGLEISDAAVRAFTERTDGWAAALQLSSLSLRRGGDPESVAGSLTGDHRLIADYLVSEVLSALAEDTRRFLLDTCVLERMNQALCDAVTESTGAAAMIQSLEDANLFLIPLDEHREWFRYHHLFAELLRKRLLEVDPARLRALHGRAAVWFDEQGVIDDALSHARLSGDGALLAALVGKWGIALISRSEVEVLMGWLEHVGDLEAHPWLQVLDGWRAVLLNDRAAVAEIAAGGRLPDPAQLPPEAQGQVEGVRCYAALQTGQVESALALSLAALKVLPAEAHVPRAAISINAGTALSHQGRYDEALALFRAGYEAGVGNGNDYAGFSAIASAMDTLRHLGRWREAVELGERVGERIEAMGLGSLSFARFVALTRAAALSDMGRLDEAKVLFDGAVDAAGLHPRAEMALRLMRVRHVELFSPDEVRAAIDDAVGLAANHSREVQDEVAGERAVFFTRLGELEAADEAIGGVSLDALDDEPRNARFARGRLRLGVARDEPGAAALARHLAENAEQRGHLKNAIELLVVVALSGDLAALERAASLARPAGFRRAFIEEHEALAPLARKLADPAEREWVLAALRGRSQETGALRGRSASPDVIDALSDRELEVLLHAAEGLSNPAIAKRLFVSTGTIKTHMHHVLGKLGAKNRTEAVKVARERGLIA